MGLEAGSPTAPRAATQHGAASQQLPPRGYPGFVHRQHLATFNAPPPPTHGAAPAPPAYGYAPTPSAYNTALLAAPAYGHAPPPPPPPPPPAYGSASPWPTSTTFGPPGAPPPPMYAGVAQHGAAAAFNPGGHSPLPAVAESATQARVGDALLNLSLKLLPELSPLPLHDPSNVFEFIEMNNNLRSCIRAICEIAGDHDPDHWHRSWITPLQRQIHTAVRNVPGTLRSPV